MPAFCSTWCPRHNRNLSEPSKMFGLINCEHKGFVAFEFDDYPEDIFQDVGKVSLITTKSYSDHGIIKEVGVIRTWKTFFLSITIYFISII